eukprot:scaffold1596_cov302-Pinguiococcus_pyrenoidosus.AAC.21
MLRSGVLRRATASLRSVRPVTHIRIWRPRSFGTFLARRAPEVRSWGALGLGLSVLGGLGALEFDRLTSQAEVSAVQIPSRTAGQTLNMRLVWTVGGREGAGDREEGAGSAEAGRLHCADRRSAPEVRQQRATSA